MQTTLTGEFVLEPLPGANLRIANRLEPGEFVILRDVRVAPDSWPRTATQLVIDWAPGGGMQAGGVRITLSIGAATASFEAASALLHEPRAALYEHLPLPRFTPEMARFWRRVFRIVRLPGGRWLLAWIGRRARRGA
jgi:hypothetical protein